MIMNKMRNVKV